MHVVHEGTCSEPGLPRAHLLRPCARRVSMSMNTCIINELYTSVIISGRQANTCRRTLHRNVILFTLQPNNLQNLHALAAFVYDY